MVKEVAEVEMGDTFVVRKFTRAFRRTASCGGVELDSYVNSRGRMQPPQRDIIIPLKKEF